MGNWKTGVLFIGVLIFVLIVFFSSEKLNLRYSPSKIGSLGDGLTNVGNAALDSLNPVLSCPGEYSKKIAGYGVDIIKLADDLSREDCLLMYSNMDQETKTASLASAKNRAISACKDSIPNIEFTCQKSDDSECADCEKNVGNSSCDDVHDNKIEAVSLARGGGRGLCNMKASATAFGDVPISCISETC